MKERTNEEQLDLFADLIEPAGEILSDKDVRDAVRARKNLRAVKMAIKGHKRAVIEILALLDGEDPEAYKVNLIALPLKLIEFLNKPEVKDLFTLQGEKTDAASSSSAMESTEDGAN